MYGAFGRAIGSTADGATGRWKWSYGDWTEIGQSIVVLGPFLNVRFRQSLNVRFWGAACWTRCHNAQCEWTGGYAAIMRVQLEEARKRYAALVPSLHEGSHAM